MCRDCLFEESPEREGVVCEDGAYTINLKLCAACKKRGTVRNVERKVVEKQDGSEEITYTHLCEFCNHVVAVHHYNFQLNTEEGLQEYSMECMLCGNCEDSHSIDPIDPRQMSQAL